MKFLHIYDHTYYEHNGDHYSSGVFGAKAWEPYFQVFDNLTVMANLSENKNVDINTFDISSRKGVSFLFVENKRLFDNYVKSFIKTDQQLVDAIKEHDGIIVRLPSELGLFAINEARKLNKPYAVEVVGCAWDSYWHHGSVKGKIMAYITFKRMKKALLDAPFAIYVTQHYLQDLYPSKGKTAFASNVILPDISDDEILNKHLKNLDKPKPKMRIGLVGTLNVKYKGHLEAILALKEITDNIPDYELLFVGKGDTQWLDSIIEQNQMKDKVKIIGKLSSGKAVFDFLDDLDLYIHPSKHEGLPRAVIEAMSRACPVLASSVAGTPELLPDEYLHKPGNHHELATQLKRVLNNKDLLKEMAHQNFEMSKEYSFSKIKKRKFDFWKNYLSALTK